MPFKSALKPKLITARSYVWRCASCRAWGGRTPMFLGITGGGKGDCCERCGCTSFAIHEGRPFGRKSKHWGLVEMWFDESWMFIHEFDYHTVVTLPPLEKIPRNDEGHPIDMQWYLHEEDT